MCLVTQSCPTLCDPRDCSPPGSSVHGDSAGKNTEVGCHPLQGIFLTQGSNPGLPHCRWILYHLSHQGSPLLTISSVQLLSRVQLFVTPWTGARQALLSMGLSRQEYWSRLPFPSPGDHPDPASGFFPMSQLFASGEQNIGASASASVLPMNIQG